jgi:hypothetical protein
MRLRCDTLCSPDVPHLVLFRCVRRGAGGGDPACHFAPVPRGMYLGQVISLKVVNLNKQGKLYGYGMRPVFRAGSSEAFKRVRGNFVYAEEVWPGPMIVAPLIRCHQAGENQASISFTHTFEAKNTAKLHRSLVTRHPQTLHSGGQRNSSFRIYLPLLLRRSSGSTRFLPNLNP